MGMYINSIYSSDKNRHKVDIMAKYVNMFYAISTYLESVNFSNIDMAETLITKQ